MAINEIAKTAAEGLSSSARMENKPGKFEVPGTQDATEKAAASPERYDTQDIRDNYGDIPNETENTNPLEPVERDSESFVPQEKQSLTDSEKRDLKKETGWSGEIIDSIGSPKEAEIYKEAGLKEVKIGEKPCLIRSDIDLNQTDADGITNRERMERGQPPLTKDGQTVELHHVGQHADSPLAELTASEHRSEGNYAILHDKTGDSEIDRADFAKERHEHWKIRTDES